MKYYFLLILSIVTARSCAVELRLCYEEWSPYATHQGKKDKGIIIDKLNDKAATLEWRLLFTELPHKRCVNGVLANKYDAALFVDTSDGLTLVPKPIVNWRLGFAVSELHPAQSSTDIHYGLLLLAHDYDYPEALANKLQRLPLVKKRIPYYSTNDNDTRGLFNYLVRGHADVMLVDEVWAGLMKQRLKLKIRVLQPAIHVEPQFIGLNSQTAEQTPELLKNISMLLEE